MEMSPLLRGAFCLLHKQCRYINIQKKYSQLLSLVSMSWFCFFSTVADGREKVTPHKWLLISRKCLGIARSDVEFLATSRPLQNGHPSVAGFTTFHCQPSSSSSSTSEMKGSCAVCGELSQIDE